MEQKNLLLIVPTLQLGGQERIAVNTAAIMAEWYRITLVVFDGRGAVYMPPCEVVDLKIPAANGTRSKIKNALLRAHRLRKLKREKKADVSLSFGSTANLANMLSGDAGNALLAVHGYGSVSGGRIGPYLYRRCRKVVCVSKVIASALVARYHIPSERVAVLYNPYDVPSIRKQAEEPVEDYTFSPNTVVAHGRLDEIKNYPRLIKAFSVVKKTVSDAQLLMIGEGPHRTQLESLIRAYDLEQSITLLGFRKNPFPYLSRAALYVLSSYSEGFPNALVEGMAFLPAVAVDCKSGPREILCESPDEQVTQGFEEVDYGVLVAPSYHQEFCAALTDEDRTLAAAILWVLSDPAKGKRLKDKARLRAEAFSTEQYRTRLQQLFQAGSERKIGKV